MNIRHSKKFDITYMKIAQEIAQLSYCINYKVGCIIVKNNSIIAEGYNGTPAGFINVCECEGKTKSEVLHAETNAIAKVAKSTNSSVGATLYTTFSPCIECAKLIIQCGIIKVVYLNKYRLDDGIDLLKLADVEIHSLDEIMNAIGVGDTVILNDDRFTSDTVFIVDSISGSKDYPELNVHDRSRPHVHYSYYSYELKLLK